MKSIIGNKRIESFIIMFPFIFLFSGFLTFKDSDKVIIVFFITSIITLIINKTKEINIIKLKHPPMAALLISCVFVIISNYTYGASSREIRALIGCFIFLLIFPWQLLTIEKLSKLLFLGSIFSLTYTIYYSLFLDLGRGEWPINAVPSATMSATICILNFCIFIHSKNKNQNGKIAFAGFLFSCITVLLTETRGSWLALGLAIFLILVQNLKSHKSYFLYTFILGVFIALTLHKPILERVEQTKDEISNIQSGNYSTSIGLRLEMWVAATQLIKESPILGSGKHHRELLEELKVTNDKISPLVIKYQPAHYHNQYLDKTVKGGIIGLLILIFLLFSPLATNIKNKFYKQIITSVVCIYAVSSLTDVPFNLGQPIMLFLLLTIPLSYTLSKVQND